MRVLGGPHVCFGRTTISFPRSSVRQPHLELAALSVTRVLFFKGKGPPALSHRSRASEIVTTD